MVAGGCALRGGCRRHCEILFGAPEGGGKVVALSIVDVDPPTTFSFRWEFALVTFDLTPQGDGTLLRFHETGSREMG